MHTYYVYTAHSRTYLGTVKALTLADAQALLDRELIMDTIVTEHPPTA